jgi:restriction endonuclease S subunit
MNSYTISTQFNPNKVFLIRKNELEKRLDPEYYVPDLVAFEKRILAKKPKKLRDYVKSIASGSTPATTEQEKYYAEKENGIPFLRVQNLSSTGLLEYDDCKYINEETHNGLLKRSQVSAGDLLVKITGVGRMAVASVAPEGFVGNINQHVCVIKTGDRKISETLAAFLNTDIGERLASRRSAGGTRPALDYPALLSIPIIDDERIIEITKKVIAQKQKNEAEAEKLLASIDDYLLAELGIVLPEKVENALKNRVFLRNINKLSGNRFDGFYYQNEFDLFEESINSSKYHFQKLLTVLNYIASGATLLKSESEKFYTNNSEIGIPLLRVQNITSEGLKLEDVIFINQETHHKDLKRSQVFEGDLLITITGRIGSSAVVPINFEGNINQHSVIIRTTSELINNEFLATYFNSYLGQKLVLRNATGGTRPALDYTALKNIQVPVPPLEIQEKIVTIITNIRQQAKTLQNEAKTTIEEAKRTVEAMILG